MILRQEKQLIFHAEDGFPQARMMGRSHVNLSEEMAKMMR